MITANEIVAFEHGNIRRIAVVNAVSGGQLYHGRRMSKPDECFSILGTVSGGGHEAQDDRNSKLRQDVRDVRPRSHRLATRPPSRAKRRSSGRRSRRDRPVREEQAWRREAASKHTFTDTNRHLVEVPDSFAVARWSRNADVATIARCILATLKYEPHTADTAALRQALEIVIKNEVGSLRRVPLSRGPAPAHGLPDDRLDRADGRTQVIEEEEGEWTL